MEFDAIMQKRRSIRKFSSQPVPPDTLRAIGEAGRLAPSARNEQQWRFTAVTSPALLAEVAAACNGQEHPANAPAILAVSSTSARVMACGQSAATVDSSIAMACMMLKATELGLGSCWLGSFLAPQVKELLALPEDAAVVALLVLGYPAEEPAPRPRKALDEVFEIR